MAQQIAIIANNFNRGLSINLRRSLKSTSESEILSAFLSTSQDERIVVHKRLETHFLRITNDYDGYSGMYYVDAEGRVVVSVADKKRNILAGILTDSSDNAGQQEKSRTRIGLEKLFHRIKSTPLLLSSGGMEWFIPPRTVQTEGPFIDEEGRLSFLAGLAIMDYENGAFGGVVIIRRRLDMFVNRLKSVKFFDENPVWLFDAHGRRLIRPDGRYTSFNPIEFISPNFSTKAMIRTFEKGLVASRDLSIVPGEPFIRIAFAIPSTLLLKDFKPTMYFFLFMLIVSAMVVFSVAVIISRNFSEPIVELAKAASRLASGDLSTRVNVQSTGEVKVLVNSFNKMTENLQKSNTALQATAKELKLALAKEKELSELQRQFVSMASHELRTPLSIIDGSAQILARKGENITPDYLRARTGKIRNAVQRMTRLMESTLTAARMEEGKIGIEIAPCDIGKVVREVCARDQEVARSHVISCDLADLPDTIQADSGAVEQLLTNLLSNAVKYAPDAPEILVKARAEGHEVVISVRDHGLGIDEDDLPRMFERFFRAGTSTGIAGTGIGLSLVKALVEMHDGSINVDSIKGEGSIFTIRLPIAGPEQSEQTDASAA